MFISGSYYSKYRGQELGLSIRAKKTAQTWWLPEIKFGLTCDKFCIRWTQNYKLSNKNKIK
jgi:hypothetical protein